MKTIGKFLAVCVILLMVACLISGLLPDSPPPDESLLSNYSLPVENGENAFPFVVDALNAVGDDADSISALTRSKTASCEEISETTKKHNVSFSLFEQASEKDYYFNNEADENPDIKHFLPTSAFMLVRLPQLKIKLATMDKQCVAECDYDCALKYYRLSHLITSGTSFIIEFSVALSIKQNIFPLIDKALHDGNVNLKEKSLAFEETINKRNIYEGLSNSFKAEYRLNKMLIHEYQKVVFSRDFDLATNAELGIKKLKLIMFFKENRMLSFYADAYNNYLPHLGNLTLNEIEACNNKLLPSTETLHGNYLGYLAMDASIFLPCEMSDLVIRNTYSTDLLDKMLSIKLALLAYEEENSSFPKTLNELSPEYLSTIPLDPLNGKQIQYDKEKRILYSVGFNFIDDGGITDKPLNIDASAGNQMEQKDIVLNL